MKSDSTSKTPTELPLDEASIAKIAREEIDRGNQFLTFAQGQIEQDRKFFRYLYTTAAGFLILLAAIAGAVQYSSVNQMRNDMKAAVEAELSNVRTEVHQRIDTEFRSDNIATIIASVAKERTNKEISGIIHNEVSKSIEEQNPLIRDSVAAQTKEAVSKLQPIINDIVQKETKEQITASVAPIQSRMEVFNTFITIGNIATLARNDDRPSFDYLLEISEGKRGESKDVDLKKIADSTVSAIITEKTSGVRLTRSFKEPQTIDALKQFLTSTDRRNRQAALDSFPATDKSILPILITLIRSDDSLAVLDAAVLSFNRLTGQSYQFFQVQEILDWWEGHKQDYRQ